MARRSGRSSRRSPVPDAAGAASPAPASRSRSVRWLAAALLAAGTLVYANSFFGGLVADDEVTIAKSPSATGATLSAVFFPGRESPVAGRPLASASFALNYAIDGLNLRGYHAVNLALHLACALLLFGIVRRTLRLPRLREMFGARADALAFAIALVWLVHPLTSEVVDYLTQRTESMMALCYLATIYATVRAADGEQERAWLGAGVVACALGMAGKESMATAPIAVLLFERTFVFDSFREMMRRRRGSYYAALAATWVLLAALVSTGARRYSAGFTSGASPVTYLLNQAEMIARYLYLTVWPRSLVLVYGPMPTVTFGEVLPYVVVVLAALGLTLAAMKTSPPIGFLAAWVFLTLAPSSSIVPIWTEVGAERRMYLPLAGVITLAVIAIDAALGRWRMRKIGGALLAGLAIAFGMRTVLRNRDYASPLRMARTVVARWPTPTAHTMLGTALAATGDHDGAIAELEGAAPAYPPAQYYLGGELFNAGRLDEAIADLELFTKLAPLSSDVPNAEAMIGRAYLIERNWPAAVGHLSRAVALDPSNIAAHGYVADALFGMQRFADAVPAYRQYLAARPSDAGALSNLGIALAASNRGDEAIAVFRRAVEADPRNTSARRNLVRALLNADQPGPALDEAQRAVAAAPADAASHELLGRALAMQGQLESAAREFERALAIDPANVDAADDLRAVRRAGAAFPRRN